LIIDKYSKDREETKDHKREHKYRRIRSKRRFGLLQVYVQQQQKESTHEKKI